MSAIASDAFEVVVKKLGKLRKKQPWQSGTHTWCDPMKDEHWPKVSDVMIHALDELRADGVGKPLDALQEVAFVAALKPGALPHVHTAALWLTDTRLRVEAFRVCPGDRMLRRPLEERGILKAKVEDAP